MTGTGASIRPLQSGERRIPDTPSALAICMQGRQVYISAHFGGKQRLIRSNVTGARQLFGHYLRSRNRYGARAGYIEAYAPDDRHCIIAWEDAQDVC